MQIKNIFLLFLTLILILSSCTNKKQLVYLQDIDHEGAGTFHLAKPLSYKVQPQDILYIKILSLNTELSDVFNNVSSQYQQTLFQNETSMYINGYTISDSGYVELPALGKILVSGLTIDEAKKNIQTKADFYLKDATVIVKLLSFKFTVMGEVMHPGVYRNLNNQLTVLEAIGMAGDITDYGDRKNVLVIRPTQEGTKTYRINLTDKNLLSSDAFFLLPNDIVYVEPIKSKIFRINTPTISLFLSTITTLILVLNFIK